LALKS